KAKQCRHRSLFCALSGFGRNSVPLWDAHRTNSSTKLARRPCLTLTPFSCRYGEQEGKMNAQPPNPPTGSHAELIERLQGRSIVFVGLMGAGKTAIGRKVATMLSLPFIASDHEIETVSRMTIPELFEAYGEPEFRALE